MNHLSFLRDVTKCLLAGSKPVVVRRTAGGRLIHPPQDVRTDGQQHIKAGTSQGRCAARTHDFGVKSVRRGFTLIGGSNAGSSTTPD